MFQENSEQKDIKSIILKHLRYWYIFAIGAFIALSIAMIYLRYTTPMYRTTTTLLFKDDEGSGLSESSAFSDLELLNTSKSIDNEIIILKSFSLMEKVLSELSLNMSFIMKGQVRDIEIYGKDVPVKFIIDTLYTTSKSFDIQFKDDNSFILKDESSSSTHKFGQQIIKPYGIFTIVSTTSYIPDENSKPLTVRFHDIKNLAKSYSSKLSIYPINSNASVLSIGITDAVPQKGEDIISQLIDVYNRAAVDDKNQIAKRTVEFIDNRLDYLTQELTAVEMNVQEYMRENELADVSSQAQQYLQIASANRQQVEEIEIQLDVLRSIENYLNSQTDDQYELVPSGLTIQDATLISLITKFNELQLDRERMLRTTHPNNPVIQNINEQLGNLKNNILENLKNIKKGLGITRRNLLAKSGDVGSRISQVPIIERQLIEITRQQEIKKALYLYLLQKKEESALSLAATVSNTRVIDPPTSTGPVSPNKTNILAYSLILGLFIPFAGLYLLDLLNTKIQNKKEVEKLTKTPILGDICHDNTGNTVIAEENSRSPISEMFRLIRTNLRISAAGKENKVILVTSSMSGEGKTFFSINLGNSLAGAGKKVLIMEFDLRKPKLIKSLDLKRNRGLTDYLIGEITDYNGIIRNSQVNPNLDIIGAGTLPPNPAEIILNSQVGPLISKLKESYDYIILDTPPVGKVADALTLNDYIDSTIYIVRYNYTQKDQLKIIDDIFINQKLKQPLLVLNDSKKSNSDSYAYGY